MAEKGGKDSSGSLKGKDGPGNARQVQLDLSSDSEGFLDLDDDGGDAVKSAGKSSLDSLKTGRKSSLGSLKSGGKASDAKGFSGKGGKDYKSGKDAGKGAAKPKVLLETDVRLTIELPKNAKILMDCEAADVLEGIRGFLPSISQDASLKMPVSFNKALQHVQNGVQYTSSDSVRQVLDSLKPKGVSDGEICMIANIFPETTEEVYALVPSLRDKKQKNEDAIREALSKLADLRSASGVL